MDGNCIYAYDDVLYIYTSSITFFDPVEADGNVTGP